MIKKLHFVGIGGSGISGVASLAKKFEYEVSGCDLEASTAYGKDIVQGHDPSHVKDADLVIISPAVLFQNKDNPEIIEAKKQNKLMTWEEFVGKVLLKNKKLICIAGTHGKSTTTAMAGKLLIDSGFDPTVIVGARVPEWGGNSRWGRGEYAIVEADEFNNNFLFYKPEIAVINNIEFDHPDFFKNESEVRESFEKFKNNLVGRKLLITSEDSPQKHFNLKIFGEHNQKNANMVFLLGKALGIKEDKIIESIEKFEGIERRMELIADRSGIKVYDDYAHHPTAIKVTLEGVREKYPGAKILVVDEPHGYKRTKALLSEYKEVFDSANEVIIGPIFKARDEVDASITPQKVADASGHKNITAFNNSEQLIENCRLIIGNYNVVVIMGAGKSYLWAKEIASLIPVKFADLTSFRTGGKIKKYIEIKTKDELDKTIKSIKEKESEIFILGGGTDILVSDKDFGGVVVKYTASNIEFLDDGRVKAESGAEWDKVVEESVKNNLQGIECLSGIPGTAGASPVQNIGAYGHELSEVFEELEAYDIKNGRFIIFNKKECGFGYRESIFKQKEYWQKYIITSVTLKLNKNGIPSAGYESLKKYLPDKVTIQSLRDTVLKVRSEKLEDPKKIGNAGSFFMNPVVDKDTKERLESMYSDIPIYPFDGKYKISAGWLVEQTGWKGKTFKTAGVSPKHAIILINPKGKAKSNDVYDLSEKIISDVFNKFGVKMEREVQLINF